MRIVCDRCRKNTTDFEVRSGWRHVKISEKGYGETGNYYLCKECSSAFYKFLDNKAGEQE